nr:hypothetical protein [Halorussus salinisoli]
MRVLEPGPVRPLFGALTAIEAATDAEVETVVAYEPAALPDDCREETALADRTEALIEEGERRKTVNRCIEQVLHPEWISCFGGTLCRHRPSVGKNPVVYFRREYCEDAGTLPSDSTRRRSL